LPKVSRTHIHGDMQFGRTSQVILLFAALCALGLYAWSSGYRVGKDIAAREGRTAD
jgi:hypothetical protein